MNSFQIQKKIQKLFNDKLISFNVKIVYMLTVRVNSFFTFKDKLSKMLPFRIVYKYKVRICKHLGTSHLTGKKVKIDNNKLTVIQQHHLCCSYSPSYEDFSVLMRKSNDFKLKIMESLLIAREKPCLNKADSSLPLELFWYNLSGYHMMFYHITWCPSITLCVYNCQLLIFQYYIMIFAFYQKQNVWAFNIILGMTMKAVTFKS